MTEYKPITPQQQPKFAGIKTFLRLPYLKTIQGLDFAVAGIPWDGATSYRTGQRLGPDAIRKVSVTLRPYNLAQDVGIFEHCSGVDYGDVSVVPGYIEDTYDKIEADLRPLVEAGVIPVVMGGDHSITLPELRAIARTHGPIALIHYPVFNRHCSDFQHHSNLVALEIFRAATAFAPDFGRQFIPSLPFESEALEKFFRQGEGKQML